MQFDILRLLILSTAVGLTQSQSEAFSWAQLCTSNGAPIPTHPVVRPRQINFITSTSAATPNPCKSPMNYQKLSEIEAVSDEVVPLSVEMGANNDGASTLCFVYQATAQITANPVIRVPHGSQLVVPLTNNITNNDASGTINCAIQTFAGGECVEPESGFRARPGRDDPYYPIESVVPHIADGTTNLHTHGFFVSPRPCHDEVIRTTLYPINWGGPTPKLLPCQDTPNRVTYSFQLPNNHPAGVYWYHTHRHGQEQAQQMMGASGPIVVEGEDDRLRKAKGVTDEVIMIRDIPIFPTKSPSSTAAAKAQPTAHQDPLNGIPGGAALAAVTSTSADVSIDPRIDRTNEVACRADDPDTGGPQATHLTLNGAVVPEAEQFPPSDEQLLTKTMKAGERQLWRIVNGAAQTTLSPQLVLVQNGESRVLPLPIVARDGVPIHDDDGTRRVEIRDTAKQPLLLPTAGRVEFIVHAPPPGATLYFDSQQVVPGCAGDSIPARRLLRVLSSGTEAQTTDDSDILPSGQETEFTDTLASPPEVRRVMAFTEYPRTFTVEKSGWSGAHPGPGDFDPDATDFFLTMIQSSDGAGISPVIHPFRMNGPPDVVVNLNGRDRVTEEWVVQNYTLEQHTFHMHQTHFRDITNGADNTAPVLDTVVVPPAARGPSPSEPGMDIPMKPGQVTLRMTFTRTSVGEFVFHCHIGEHVDNGMMQRIAVIE